MVRIFICMMILLLPQFLRSQEDLSIGTAHTFYSAVLDEERTFLVALPAGYDENSDQHYPVLYLADGENYFHLLYGIQHMFSRGRMQYRTDFILVGIINTDRTRDLTPTASTTGRDGNPGFYPESVGGGADRFAAFLQTELFPEIDRQFRTNGERLIVGHSLAGLFVLHMFLNHPGLFTAYLAIDPSLWWDNGKLEETAATQIDYEQQKVLPLYIGIAAKEIKSRTTIQGEKAAIFLNKILPDTGLLYYNTHFFPNESHGTVYIPGLLDGLKLLYGNEKDI